MDEITKKEFRKNVGKQIQKLRKDAGYTSAKAFAERIGFNPNTYTQYEQGVSGFNYEQAWIMADALECSMDELGGREWPKDGADQVLTADEHRLVDDYRRMEPEDQQTITKTASTFALAGKAKKETAQDPAPEADPRRQTEGAA